MSDYRSIAQMIPSKYRRKILEENLVYKAISSPTDLHMKALVIIWRNFVDPQGDYDESCGSCLNTVLTNYKEIIPELIALEREDNLLDL